ncbi:uncharacterized protein LOC130827697 [Amaranthus tricolor]|uniref:uncharacterized protein LOC130827697 n=1 Tax=Amaranthus tricolor TaxID=29722 RepID=UPI002582F074|nr:uncharacterized protein LOC130827697 [Amaranthus tricolor]
MATPDIFQKEKDLLLYASIFGDEQGDTVKSRGALIEKKIEFLESLASNVSNRRSRRLVNDRLLMELVPRLNAEEIRGLFAPPPWGEEVPLSPFYKANMGDWDKFRHIDMDKEANIMKSSRHCSQKQKSHVDPDKMTVMNAWHRIDCRTREALRRSFLPELLESYENRIRAFIGDENDAEVLMLQVHDPFHRLLLHGVCEFYDLVSVTETQPKVGSEVKMTKIKKKKSGSSEMPFLTLSHFLKMSKEGKW